MLRQQLFTFKPLFRAFRAEAVRAEREQTGPEIWVVEVVSVRKGDYHRVGDRILIDFED